MSLSEGLACVRDERQMRAVARAMSDERQMRAVAWLVLAAALLCGYIQGIYTYHAS